MNFEKILKRVFLRLLKQRYYISLKVDGTIISGFIVEVIEWFIRCTVVTWNLVWLVLSMYDVMEIKSI